MRPLRFPTAFAAALGAHTAVALALALAPRAHAASAIARPLPQELVIETEELTPPAPAPSTPAAASEHAHPSARSLDAARASREPINATLGDVPAQAEPVPPPTEGYGRAPAPSASIDLGIGAYWKSVAMGAPVAEEPPPVASAEPPRPSIDQMLRDSLEARDHELGLGSAGPLVSAAHDAASLAFAPDTGGATFEVVSDAEGRVTSANIVSVSADGPAWSDVARELVSLMSSKRLHVPRGAHGYRARLRITAERALPAGSKTTSAVGAVPDDIPGGEKSCEGEGMHRKCTKGSPIGATGTWGDLSKSARGRRGSSGRRS